MLHNLIMCMFSESSIAAPCRLKSWNSLDVQLCTDSWLYTKMLFKYKGHSCWILLLRFDTDEHVTYDNIIMSVMSRTCSRSPLMFQRWIDKLINWCEPALDYCAYWYIYNGNIWVNCIYVHHARVTYLCWSHLNDIHVYIWETL